MKTKRCCKPTLAILTVISLLLHIAIASGQSAMDYQEAGPLKIKQTNVKDTKFTISWCTSLDTTGYIKYGQPPNLEKTAYDDRGKAVTSKIHHVTLRNLTPNTTYYYQIISGDEVYQNSSTPFIITTAPSLIASESDVAYGRLLTGRGLPYTKGAIVYLTLIDKDGNGSGGESCPVSIMADKNGYWSYELKNFREKDLKNLFTYSKTGDELKIEVQPQNGSAVSLVVDTASDSPVRNIFIQEIRKVPYYEAY